MRSRLQDAGQPDRRSQYRGGAVPRGLLEGVCRAFDISPEMLQMLQPYMPGPIQGRVATMTWVDDQPIGRFTETFSD